MTLRAMSAPRSSVFTFESSVHSGRVLRRLDEQRRRDLLCDVTVVAGGRSFRAHRSVLASCSEYFTNRVSSLSQHAAVVTLPQEVTAAGFEPLLQFAYTSKLHFGKDDVVDIRSSASVLGFRDLDEACFDFLLPRLLSGGDGSARISRKRCCKKKHKGQLSKAGCRSDADAPLLNEKEAKPVADSSSRQEAECPFQKSPSGQVGSQNSTGTKTPAAKWTIGRFLQCPKYRKFQLACGKDVCVPEKSPGEEGGLSSSPRPSGPRSTNKTKQTNAPSRRCGDAADEPRKSDGKSEGGVGSEEAGLEAESKERDGVSEKKETERDVVGRVEEMVHAAVVGPLDRPGVRAVPSERSPGLMLNHCPLRVSAGGPEVTRSPGQERFVMDREGDTNPGDSGAPETDRTVDVAETVGDKKKDDDASLGERRDGRQEDNMERETLVVNPVTVGSVVEKVVGSVSDAGSGQLQDASFDLGSGGGGGGGGGGCPFLQDLDPGRCMWKGGGLSECEGTSHSGVSSLNSGEDEDSETETEGDSESCATERDGQVLQVQLPFSIDRIMDLSRNDFQQLLKQKVFTAEQLEFVYDMRRRGKNRLAAQRCRKRKLDCIYNLQCEINKLKTEREKLMMEKSQLSQLKLTTCHSVSALCHRVCSEANLRPEQLQVLAKYTSTDCPLSCLIPHMDALLSQPGSQLAPPPPPSGPDGRGPLEEALSSDAVRREGPGSL